MKLLTGYPVPNTSATDDVVADYADFHVDAISGALSATVFIYDRKEYEAGVKTPLDTQVVRLAGSDYQAFLGGNQGDVDLLGRLIWGLFATQMPATFGTAPDYTPPVTPAPAP